MAEKVTISELLNLVHLRHVRKSPVTWDERLQNNLSYTETLSRKLSSWFPLMMMYNNSQAILSAVYFTQHMAEVFPYTTLTPSPAFKMSSPFCEVANRFRGVFMLN